MTFIPLVLNLEILNQCRRNRCNPLILSRERIRLIWLAKIPQFLLSATDFEKLIKFFSPRRLLTHLQPAPVRVKAGNPCGSMTSGVSGSMDMDKYMIEGSDAEACTQLFKFQNLQITGGYLDVVVN